MPPPGLAALPRGGQGLKLRVVVLLGCLQAVGPVSTDMYLPSFPAMEASFHSAPGSAQWTLGAWVLGLCVGQILQGALSDRFGRRRPILAGTLVFTAGAVGCAVATSLVMLSAFRFVAAFGASASMVGPRAIVRDVAQGHEAAKLMSRLTLVLGAAPILAPSLGGAMLEWASWRGVLWTNAAYGMLALLAAWLLLPDTLPPAARRPLHLGELLKRGGHILCERHFLTHTMMVAFCAFSLFVYLGGTPIVFIQIYGFTPQSFALIFGGVAATYILMSQINIPVVRRFGLGPTLRVASTIFFAVAVAQVICARMGVAAPVLMVVLALLQGMTGFIVPTAIVGALRHHGAHAGAASAMMGTLQYGLGAIGGVAVGWLSDGSNLPMALLMLLGAGAVKTADLLRPTETLRILLS